MGSKQSKIEGESEYFPATPTKNRTAITVTTNDYYDEDMNNLDPRSPNVCRTPLNELRPNEDAYSTATEENFDELPITPIQQPQKSESFKNKLFKGLKCNIFDPRSPSTFINRTPIVFKENTIEDNPADKSLNLNDTFSDLFIDNDSNTSDNKNNEIAKESTRIEETVENSISVENENDCDPRSPTIGVDRTPIIFSDDSPDENVMIESVLETLKLNELQKPQNKQLERIKNPRRKTRSSARIAAAVASNKMSIYKDRDVKIFSTPKKSAADNLNETGENNLKRTPLGCVANKSHLRSKSSENMGKTNKARPLISSFDDYNLKSLQKEIGNGENIENNSSMNNFIAKVN